MPNKNIIADIKERYALALIDAEEHKGTKQSAERAEKMRYYLSNFANDNGAFGRLFELATARARSNKDRVSAQGKADTFVKVVRDGRAVYMPAEVKTNGGRIESLYAKNAVRLVVVALCFSNSTGTRFLMPKILPTAEYLEILEECGAIKMTNGTRNERAVQPSNKSMYERLADALDFDADREYTAEELGLD